MKGGAKGMAPVRPHTRWFTAVCLGSLLALGACDGPQPAQGPPQQDMFPQQPAQQPERGEQQRPAEESPTG